MADSFSTSVINNSVSNESRVDCFDIFRKVWNKCHTTATSRPEQRVVEQLVKTARTVHNASHLAARHVTAAASREDNAGPRDWQL